MIELENIKCDICESNDYTDLFKTRDYRFGHKEEYSIVKCNKCGLIYLNPRPNIEIISKLYEQDYTPENEPETLPESETKEWRKILRGIWHKINGQYVDEIISIVKGRVLDVGCGNGYLLLSLKQKGCEVYGIEANPKYVNICNKLGLKVFCGILEDAKFPDVFFDIVLLSQVIEHLSSPKQTLKEIHRILKPDGKVLIYCPNANSYLAKLFGKYWHGWHVPFHFYGFSQKTIRKLVEESGFKVKKIESVTPDHFFTVSLKCFLWGKRNNSSRPIDKTVISDSLIFRFFLSPIFRILDFLLRGKGDCLKVVMVKK